jgi:hypothetical protein
LFIKGNFIKNTLSIKDRKEQLEKALKALINANNNYQKTKDDSYLLDIWGRLRSLVCTGGWSMTPLLLNLMNEEHINIELYSWSKSKIKLTEKGTFSVIMGKTWQVFKYADYGKYSFSDWLLEPFYYSEVDNKFYSRNDTIKKISNSNGGSHYDLKVPFILDKMKRVEIGHKDFSQTMVEQILLDMGMAVYWAGKKYLSLSYLETIKNVGSNSHVIKTKKEIHDLDIQFDLLDRDKFRGSFLLGNKNNME